MDRAVHNPSIYVRASCMAVYMWLDPVLSVAELEIILSIWLDSSNIFQTQISDMRSVTLSYVYLQVDCHLSHFNRIITKRKMIVLVEHKIYFEVNCTLDQFLLLKLHIRLDIHNSFRFIVSCPWPRTRCIWSLTIVVFLLLTDGDILRRPRWVRHDRRVGVEVRRCHEWEPERYRGTPFASFFIIIFCFRL